MKAIDRLRLIIIEKVHLKQVKPNQWRERVKILNKEFKGILKKCPRQRIRYRLIKSLDGIGPDSAEIILTFLPELGRPTVSHNRIFSLAGLIPHEGSKYYRKFLRNTLFKVVRRGRKKAILLDILRVMKVDIYSANFNLEKKGDDIDLVLLSRLYLSILHSMLYENLKFKDWLFGDGVILA